MSLSGSLERYAPVADDLVWHRPERSAITDYERRRARGLFAPDEPMLLAARGQDARHAILWIVTPRRLIIVTDEQFDENVRDLRHSAIARVEQHRTWHGASVLVAGNGHRLRLDGLDSERAAALVALLRARAGLSGD
ncbi:MAG: hypothetical protein MUF00_20720 [Gemmatimonadaceae bacterium]|jgi:hypothetical protein|nr:hypothetical protein [Gemmatimonadaceae bacterium]